MKYHSYQLSRNFWDGPRFLTYVPDGSWKTVLALIVPEFLYAATLTTATLLCSASCIQLDKLVFQAFAIYHCYFLWHLLSPKVLVNYHTHTLCMHIFMMYYD